MGYLIFIIIFVGCMLFFALKDIADRLPPKR